MPTVPLGSDEGERISGAGLMVTDKEAVCGVPAESLTVIVPVPAAPGVPLSTPVAELNDKPVGRLELQVYGGVPPEAVIVTAE